jgi:hypothetical protein
MKISSNFFLLNLGLDPDTDPDLTQSQQSFGVEKCQD